MGNALEKLVQLHSDCTALWEAVRAANTEARDIMAAVGHRMENNRKTSAVRVATLAAQVADESRSSTLRRLAAQELEALQNATDSANTAEIAAFDEQILAGKQAIADLYDLKQEFRETLNAANDEIRELRAFVLGKIDLDLAKNWLDGDAEKFKRLCRERVADE